MKAQYSDCFSFQRVLENAQRTVLWALLLIIACQSPGHGGETEVAWTNLFERAPSQEWIDAGNARLDSKNPKQLHASEGNTVLVSTKKGEKEKRNLVSDEKYGDLEVRLEFMLAKNSNAGVKMHSLYEIQLYDSYGVEKPTALHSGGIYPRADKSPGKYEHIDEGQPPLVNAAKPPGEWQTLHIVFRAPRFGPGGQKTANAEFELVTLNGKIVQENAEVRWPTGSDWRLPESATGRLYLQGDHGPVAYRNVQVRPLSPK